MTDTADQVKQFTDLLYEPTDIVEVRYLDHVAAASHWSPAAELVNHIPVYQRANGCKNIYVGANPRKESGARGDAAVLHSRVIFADFDGVDPAEAEMRWVSIGLPEPTLAVDSGHGAHVYLRMDRPTVNLSGWRVLQNDLAVALGGDVRVKNPERIMRLPGFLNLKSEPHVPCRIFHAKPEGRGDWQAVRKIVPAASAPKVIVSSSDTMTDRSKRCRAYLEKCPDAVAWSGGHDATFRAACECFRFGLSDAEAGSVMGWFNSAKSVPPWKEKELAHKVADARSHVDREGGFGVRLATDATRVAAWPPKRSPLPQQPSSGSVDKIITDTISGERRSVDWPWKRLNEISESLLPGKTVVFCGGPGSGKSYAILQAAFHMHAIGESVAVKMLEMNVEEHGLRLSAQIGRDSRLTKSRWVREHPEEAKAIRGWGRQVCDDFIQKCLEDGHDCNTHDDVLRWAEAKADAGCRVLYIDPVTIVEGKSKQVWIDDNAFVKGLERLLSRYNCSMVLVTHPRGGASRGKVSDPLDNIAGGQAYNRFTDSVFWYRSCPPADINVWSPFGHIPKANCNRQLILAKLRHGEGGGRTLAMHLDPNTLLLEELGELVKEE